MERYTRKGFVTAGPSKIGSKAGTSKGDVAQQANVALSTYGVDGVGIGVSGGPFARSLAGGQGSREG